MCDSDANMVSRTYDCKQCVYVFDLNPGIVSLALHLNVEFLCFCNEFDFRKWFSFSYTYTLCALVCVADDKETKQVQPCFVIFLNLLKQFIIQLAVIFFSCC